jgi:hypothetical protein
LYSLFLANLWFLGQAAEIPWVAGEHHDRPRLVKRDHREKRVERAPVPRQSALAEQFTSSAALLLANRDHCDSAERTVHACISGTATQDLAESGRSGDDSALPLASSLDHSKDGGVVGCQLGQALAVEDEGAAYSSS